MSLCHFRNPAPRPLSVGFAPALSHRDVRTGENVIINAHPDGIMAGHATDRDGPGAAMLR